MEPERRTLTPPGVPSYRRLDLSRAERCMLTELLVSAVIEAPRGRDPARPPDRADGRLWAALPALAEGHGVAALVAPALRRLAPETVARDFEDAAERTIARGGRMAADAATVTLALEAAAVPFAWTKGAWLAARLYDPPAARPLADLDLLVPTAASEMAVACLTSLGYVEAGRTWKHRAFLRPDNMAVVDRRGEHPDNPRRIEVHTRLGESFRGIELDLTAALRLDRPSSDLPLAVGMAHLAAHATVDALGRRARLIQWIDVARQAAAFDAGAWDALIQLTATPHAARFIWPALALAERTLGMQVPGAVRAALEGLAAPALRAWIAGIDLDGVSYFGRASAPRALGEIPAIWPRSAAERATVWRFIMMPGRWHLADRYPRLARSRAWPLLYARHAVYNLGRLAARWRQRG